jgi:tight adherence protein B
MDAVVPNLAAFAWAVALAVAIAASLSVWALAELGATALAQYRRLFTERASVSLRELFLFMDPKRLFVLNLALIALTGLLTCVLSGSIGVGLGVAALAAALPRLLFKFLRKRRMDKLEQQLPDALMLLAGGLKSGVGLSQAVTQLVREIQAPLSQEFDVVLREQRLGVAMDEALENFNRRLPLQSVTLVVSAMRIATETGGHLAESLERAAHTLRQKLAMEGKIRSLTAQGKLQAWVAGLLPVVMMLVLRKMEPEAMGLLFTTRIGWGTIAVILLLQFFGVLIIRKIVAIDV